MNYDEFAFFNQQLAAMVRDGIPLEAAMKRLCADMRHGSLRAELEKLGADLSHGIPLRDAVKNRKLPDLYRQMLEIGAQSNDLPGLLTLLADHYQRRQVLATKLKGLMVYPAIVLVATLVLSFILASFVTNFLAQASLEGFFWNTPYVGASSAWAAPTLLTLAVAGLVLLSATPKFRRILRWRLPAFREAQWSRVASAISLMLKQGVTFDQALALVEQMEHDTPAALEIGRWRGKMAQGTGKFPEMTSGSKMLPPLFAWVVGQSGEDVAEGFRRAAEIFQSRASYRAEALLYSALPCSILLLGVVIISQVRPIMAALIAFMNLFSNVGQ